MPIWFWIVMSFLVLIILGLLWSNWDRWKTNGSKLIANNGFNLDEYIKHPWYQYVYLPNWFQKSCQTLPEAIYKKEGDGKFISVTNKCVGYKDGQAVGVAYTYDTKGKLKVIFAPRFLLYFDKFLQLFGDINAFTGDYYILETDNVNYTLIGSRDLKYLWILSGSSDYFDNIENKGKLQYLINKAKNFGYPTEKLIKSDGTRYI